MSESLQAFMRKHYQVHVSETAGVSGDRKALDFEGGIHAGMKWERAQLERDGDARMTDLLRQYSEAAREIDNKAIGGDYSRGIAEGMRRVICYIEAAYNLSCQVELVARPTSQRSTEDTEGA